jgi:hypothetical protein
VTEGERQRPPAPLSDLFATSVHRFGRAWADLVVATVVVLAAATVPVVVADVAGAGASAKVAIGTLAYAVGYFSLLAHVVLHGLPTPAPRGQVASAYTAALTAGLAAGGLVLLLGPFAVVAMPLVLLAVPAAAAGDRDALAALPFGARLAAASFTRTWAVWALMLAFSLPIWIGVALVVFPLVGGGAQFFATLAFAAPVIWPCSALFLRALYGDLTGRLVVAPEDRTA